MSGTIEVEVYCGESGDENNIEIFVIEPGDSQEARIDVQGNNGLNEDYSYVQRMGLAIQAVKACTLDQAGR